MTEIRLSSSRTGRLWHAALLCAVCLAPVFLRFGRAGLVGTVELAAVFLGMAGVASGAALLLGRRVPDIDPVIGRPWMAFLAVGVISMCVSGRFWSALVGEPSNMLGLSQLLAMTAVALACGVFASDVRAILTRYAHWVLLVQSGLAFGQLSGVVDVAGVGTLPNSTYFGELMVLLLPWALSPRSAESRRDSLLRSFAVVLTLCALAATGSRVALVVSVAWAAWTMYRRRPAGTIARLVVPLLLVLVVAAAGLVFAGDELRGTMSLQTLGERPEMWRLGLEAVRERPLVGWGPDGFSAGATAVSSVDSIDPSSAITLGQEYADPHGLPVWVAVSTGVVGLALFGWFVGAAASRLRRLHRNGDDVAPGAWALAGLTLVLLTAPLAVQIAPFAALMFGISVLPDAGGSRAGSAGASSSRLRL